MSVNILLVGHGGFYNRGCEAIVRGTVGILRETFPECRIVLASFSPEEDEAQRKRDKIGIDKIIPAVLEGAKKPSAAWVWQTLNRRILCGNLPMQDYLHRRCYKDSDIVMSIGGDNFSDDYGGPDFFFDTLRAAKKLNARTVIWGASIGPFSPPEKEKTWAQYLREVDRITVREDKTLQYLQGIGVTGNVHRVADPAFLLPAVAPKEPVFSSDSNKIRIGLGISDLLLSREGGKSYGDACAGFAQYLAKSKGTQIMFVPHVIEGRPRLNDFDACKKVAHLLKRSCDYLILPDQLNACEMKYCVSKCDFFVGARTHSTIASLSSLVPTISVGYSVKAWGINHDLLGSDAYVVDVRTLTAQSLIEKFEQLREHETELRQKLHQSVPRAQAAARKAGKYLRELI